MLKNSVDGKGREDIPLVQTSKEPSMVDSTKIMSGRKGWTQCHMEQWVYVSEDSNAAVIIGSVMADVVP
jgi:hypothetical protein